jgi:hypothetical protein
MFYIKKVFINFVVINLKIINFVIITSRDAPESFTTD